MSGPGPHYYRKPELVEAVQWKGEGFDVTLPSWMVGEFIAGRVRVDPGNQTCRLFYSASVGSERAVWPESWFVQKEPGHLLVMEDEEFRGLYERLPDLVEQPTVVEPPPGPTVTELMKNHDDIYPF